MKRTPRFATCPLTPWWPASTPCTTVWVWASSTWSPCWSSATPMSEWPSGSGGQSPPATGATAPSPRTGRISTRRRRPWWCWSRWWSSSASAGCPTMSTSWPAWASQLWTSSNISTSSSWSPIGWPWATVAAILSSTASAVQHSGYDMSKLNIFHLLPYWTILIVGKNLSTFYVAVTKERKGKLVTWIILKKLKCWVSKCLYFEAETWRIKTLSLLLLIKATLLSSNTSSKGANQWLSISQLFSSILRSFFHESMSGSNIILVCTSKIYVLNVKSIHKIFILLFRHRWVLVTRDYT